MYLQSVHRKPSCKLFNNKTETISHSVSSHANIQSKSLFSNVGYHIAAISAYIYEYSSKFTLRIKVIFTAAAALMDTICGSESAHCAASRCQARINDVADGLFRWWPTPFSRLVIISESVSSAQEIRVVREWLNANGWHDEMVQRDAELGVLGIKMCFVNRRHI